MICEDKFGGCLEVVFMVRLETKQKDRCLYNMATMPTTPAHTCAHGHGMTTRPGKTHRHRCSNLIKFIAIDCSCSIRIRNSETLDSIFDSNEIPDSSHL